MHFCSFNSPDIPPKNRGFILKHPSPFVNCFFSLFCSLLVTHINLLWVSKLWEYTSQISTYVWIHWHMSSTIHRSHWLLHVLWNIFGSESCQQVRVNSHSMERWREGGMEGIFYQQEMI